MPKRRLNAFILVGFLIAMAAPDASDAFDIETSGSVYPSHAGDGDWRVVSSGGSDAELQVGIGGAGRADVTNGVTLTTPERVWLGASTAATAVVNVNGAAWVAEDHVGLGSARWTDANVTVTDGTWSVADSCYIGADSEANGVVNLHEGAVWTSESYVHVGHYGAGVVNVNPGASWTAEEMVNVGFFSDSSGRVNLNGGNWTSQGKTQLGYDYGGTGGEVYINAGSTLTCAGSLNVTDISEIVLDGGTLVLAGGAELAGEFGAGAGGGTVRVEVGSVDPNSDLCLVGEFVDLVGCAVEVMFGGGFAPARSDVFNLFDPIGEVDLPTKLGAAASITVPADWDLDPNTGVLSCLLGPVQPDTNSDGVVDVADYIALKTHIGQGSGMAPGDGDCDGDCDVDWHDLQILQDYFGQTIGETQTIPEPSALGLVALGGATLLCVRRRRRVRP